MTLSTECPLPVRARRPVATARVLAGARHPDRRLDRACPHPLFQELPGLVGLRTGSGGPPELRASIDLLGGELGRQAYGRDVVVPALLDVVLVHLVRAGISERAGLWATGWCVALDDA